MKIRKLGFIFTNCQKCGRKGLMSHEIWEVPGGEVSFIGCRECIKEGIYYGAQLELGLSHEEIIRNLYGE